MKHGKLIFAVVVVLGAMFLLMRAATEETAHAVVTVSKLVTEGEARSRIRLGARVAEAEVLYETSPKLRLQFEAHDPPAGVERISVVYFGLRPDTFKAGRDVILEGDFDGKVFTASSLLTQCPSKYEPKVPGLKQESK